ncbi:MAG TPA: N-acetyltransferase [Burkholderiales bacterium]|nr:N-acetyltransferase [Burkholderiales bacterium]
MTDDTIALRPIEERDVEACARMMQASDPWVTLGTRAQTLVSLLRNPDRLRVVAERGTAIAGCIVVSTAAPLSGYVQAVCVAPGERGHGIGRRLMAHVEERLFATGPNVFLFVSDFNVAAQAFYRQLGYRQVGEVPDFLVAGRSELLMRKTRGPIHGYGDTR